MNETAGPRIYLACTRPGCPGRVSGGVCDRCGPGAGCGPRVTGRRPDRRGSAASRGYGAGWRRLRKAILERDHYLCRRCRRPVGRSGHVDHVTPLPEGSNEPENLQTLCQACHNLKTAREKK